ncbi:hypothetical protein ACFWP2_14365 [Kitasatospora sp. NPDC058444]|uniref:hypothetical protein n=1 Tax=Kitasatospora sp. NPDC058444 TaxID=3346504 RepID=UPI003649F9E5
MPSVLHYEIVTDPTPLQVSRPGAPSVGAVYVVVSNTSLSEVKIEHIDVLIPVGTGSGDLTDDVSAIKASVTGTYEKPSGTEPSFAWHSGSRFRFAFTSGKRVKLPGQESFVLKLENIPVSDQAGLVVIGMNEKAANGGTSINRYPFVTNLALVKQTPLVPQNLRAEIALVDAGDDVVLHWDGPDSLTYWIRYPDGTLEPADPPARPAPVRFGPHRHTPALALNRGTTYTLVAGTTDSNGEVQEGYFLTTTVHARIPEFESGVRAPWAEGTEEQGRVTFTTGGVRVDNDNGTLGTVLAGTADVNEVRTEKVRGKGADAGWIELPDTGITVHHGPGPELGAVVAKRIDAEGVNTSWVGDRTAGKGWIEFPSAGISVRRDGGQELGTVAADKADLNGVNTEWVQGRGPTDGRVEFPSAGISVRRDGGQELGTVAADKADLNSVTTQWTEGPSGTKSRLAFTDTGVKITDPDGHRGTIVAGETNVRSVVTPWVSGPQPGAGWIAFRVEGVDVMRDSEVSFGTIRAASFEEKDGGTGRPLHRRLPPYAWPPKSDQQKPATSSNLREDPE